jgi:hypothetical protein
MVSLAAYYLSMRPRQRSTSWASTEKKPLRLRARPQGREIVQLNKRGNTIVLPLAEDRGWRDAIVGGAVFCWKDWSGGACMRRVRRCHRRRRLRAKLALISQKSKLAVAIRYALSRWEGLTLFIDDGRIELDNNSVERSIRPIASGSKSEELSLSKCLPGYP